MTACQEEHMKEGNELLKKETGAGRASNSILATVCASVKTTRAEGMPPTNRAAFKRQVTQTCDGGGVLVSKGIA